MEHIIEVKNLKKSYGKVQAVKDVSFYVEPGKLFAFLGPNGAGKSTTINTICTFLKPDEGEVIVNGYQLGKEDDKIRESIGVVFQENLLDDLLTIRENLMLRGSFYHKGKGKLKTAINNAARITELYDLLDRPYGKLSGGQRRRADIARALVHTPQILFLDEPTTGLDPQTRQTVWETILKLKDEVGMTIFLTTHYMQEAENADYCIIVDDGLVVAKGTPYELKENYAKDRLQMQIKDEDAMIRYLTLNHFSYKKISDFIEVNISNTMEALPILTALHDSIQAFSVIRGSMDDVFIGITGKEIRE